MSLPNLLLLISDQQRADTLGFRGRTPCRTSHIDRLAEQGVSFDRCIAPSPICGPARAAMFGGRYPHQLRGDIGEDLHGISGRDHAGDMMLNDYSLREPPLLTQLLKDRGYHTAYAGKWHLGADTIHEWFDEAWGYSNKQYIDWCAENGLPDGWPLNDQSVRTGRTPHMSIPVTKVNPIDPAHSNDAWIADIALKQLAERPRDKPFFQVCSFNGPHPPFKIPEPYFSMYDASDVPEPPNFCPAPGEPGCKAQSFYRLLWEDYGDDWHRWQQSFAVYWGFVTLIDDQVGRLLGALDEEGIMEETVVIFCSDHGEMLGQHGLWQKFQPYEESLRVPLVVRAPGGPAGIRSNAGVSLVDLPPTLLGLAGLEAPADWEGVDLTPVCRDGADGPAENRLLFSEQKPLGAFHGETDWRLVTENRYKYVWNRGNRDELYDLEKDPWEMDNRTEDISTEKVLNRLQEELREWMMRTEDALREEFERECLTTK